MTALPPWLETLRQSFQQRFPGFYARLPGYYLLARLDKPIGIYLLLWPTITALWIAAEGFPDFKLLVIFLLGTVVMRSAGCAVNDYADYDFDGKVARTRQRPLASGLLTRRDALQFFIALSLCGFVLVLFTNLPTILLACGGVVVVVIYPFMKRYTHLPQVVLGVAFSWGILMAFTAQQGSIPIPAWLLFIANALWIIAYDTEYAMVDRADDLEAGIKSTAILFGSADRMIIGVLQGLFIISLWLAARQLQLGGWFTLALWLMILLLAWQQFLIRHRQPAQCFKAFLHNNWIGAVMFAGVVLSYL